MIDTILKIALGFLVGLSFTIHAQEGSASATATPIPYEPPVNLEARLAALSNIKILEHRCNVELEITEKQLACMEGQNQRVIDFLQLKADRLNIHTRLAAMGASMKDKHKTFSGLSREMNRCGFKGNHAVKAWKWYKDGDKSGLDCLEAKHLEVLQEDNILRVEKLAREEAINAMKLVDCSKGNGILRIVCNAVQASVK